MNTPPYADAVIPSLIRSETLTMDGTNEPNSSSVHPHISLNAWLNTDTSEHTPLDISTRCEKCQEDLDGPCYEHTDVKRISFDKPPIPLAHSSLPDALEIISEHPKKKQEMIFAKQKIEASTLFGPLIAPLVPLDELKCGPPRYSLWSDETQELQVYDLSDDFLCNWIKFIRPSFSMKEANVIAYQQRGSIYLVAVRDILPSTEMRVYVRMPRSSSIPNGQLSLFVQSLLASYDKKQLEESLAMDTELETIEEPAPKRKKLTRRKRTKNALIPEDGSISSEPEKNSSSTFEASTAESESQPTLNEDQSIQLMKEKRVSREWSVLNKRFKSEEMTEEEKRDFENDETTIEQRAKEESRRKVTSQKAHLKYAEKVAKMTKEEREAYLEKKRLANIKNAPNNNKLYKLVREKFLAGLTLTPDELSRYEKALARNRENSARIYEKKRLEQGRVKRQASRAREWKTPMFGWQIAERKVHVEIPEGLSRRNDMNGMNDCH